MLEGSDTVEYPKVIRIVEGLERWSVRTGKCQSIIHIVVTKICELIRCYRDRPGSIGSERLVGIILVFLDHPMEPVVPSGELDEYEFIVRGTNGGGGGIFGYRCRGITGLKDELRGCECKSYNSTDFSILRGCLAWHKGDYCTCTTCSGIGSNLCSHRLREFLRRGESVFDLIYNLIDSYLPCYVGSGVHGKRPGEVRIDGSGISKST